MKVEQNERGFDFASFRDMDDQPCQIRQSSSIDTTSKRSSLPGGTMLWLGCEDVCMHLNRKQVKELVKLMKTWLKTGALSE